MLKPIDKPFDFQSLKTRAIKVNYLYAWMKKIWIFACGIQMELRSDRVLRGVQLVLSV